MRECPSCGERIESGSSAQLCSACSCISMPQRPPDPPSPEVTLRDCIVAALLSAGPLPLEDERFERIVSELVKVVEREKGEEGP